MPSLTTRVEPVYGLSGRRSVFSPYRDDFRFRTRLPAWWVPENSKPVTVTFDPVSGLTFRLTTGSCYAVGLRTGAPRGSFTAMARIAHNAGGSGSNVRSGLFVAVRGGDGTICGPKKTDGNIGAIGVGTCAITTDWGAYDGYLVAVTGTYTNWYWYRIIWNAAAGTLTLHYSADNRSTWTSIGSRSGMAQPDDMGLVIHSNSGQNDAVESLSCTNWEVLG
jgi:hypothetical protein